MTHQTGNGDPRIAAAINRAIELGENGQTFNALEVLSGLVEDSRKQPPTPTSLFSYCALGEMWRQSHTQGKLSS